MKKNKKSYRYISLIVFLLGAATLALLYVLHENDYYLVSLMSLTLTVTTIVGTILDPHISDKIKILKYFIAALFFVCALLGLILTDEVLSPQAYCVLFGSIDIMSGLIKLLESIEMLKEKNKMGVAFVIDSIIEMSFGVLMIIEGELSIRLHSFLIAADLTYEGTIKFINEFVEEKMEHKQNEKHNS